MRKFLLACAATAGFAGAAHAGNLQPGSGTIFNQAKPGEAIVRLDGAVWAMLGYGSSTNDKAVVGGQAVKNENFGLMTTLRLYPMLDGQTAGGLRYGAFGEIRTNNPASGSASRTTNTMYLNRAYGYIGGDSWGRIAMGMVDGAIGQIRVGDFQNFGQGGLNGFAPGMIAAPDNYIWRFPFSQGGEYTHQKIVYTSPSFAGFDMAASFAPSTTTNTTSDIQNIVTGGSARQATSVNGADANRYRNLFVVAARYRGTFSGLGVAAQVGYMTSGKVSVPGVARKGLSIFDAGATLSYMGFMAGGHVSTGDFNGSTSLSAPGEKDATVWLVGASYKNGPWTAGVHYLDSKRPGAFGNNAELKETGWGAGLNYAWAPGVQTFLEFVYHEREEAGVNLQIGTGPAKSKVDGTALIVGQVFRW